MRSLYDQQPEHPLPLPQIIYAVSQLEIDPNDGLPQKVCATCIKTLLKVYETVEVFRVNDSKLREQLARTMQVEIQDIVEVENVSIKQEILDEEEKQLHESTRQDLSIDGNVNDYEGNPVEPNFDMNKIPQLPMVVSTDGAEKHVETEVKIENVSDDDNTMDDDRQDPNKPKAQESTDNPKPLPPLKKKPKRPRYPTKYENSYSPHLHDFKCYICKSESHASTEALLDHLNTHLDMLPFSCSECTMENIVFKGILRVNAHLREHLKPEKCPHCDRRFESKYKTALHVQKQHAPMADFIQRPSTCKYCFEEYPSKAALLKHMRQVHSTEAASCAFCGEIFKERYLLRLHISKRHEPDKKYICNVCNKEFAAQKNLQNHTQTFHSGETFKCKFCSKKFRLEMRLQAHEKKHIENPNYVPMPDWSAYYTILEGEETKPCDLRRKRCNICGVVGAKWLTGHIQSVHFPPKYDCTVCGWSSKIKQNWETHMRMHKHGKTEQCPICERKYPDKRQLLVHLKAKMHRGHPLAESVDWLVKRKPQRSADKDTGDSGARNRAKS